MIWAVGISIIASALFLLFGIAHILDFSRFTDLIQHPNLITSSDILNCIMTGVPALFLLAGVFEIVVEVIKRYRKPKSSGQ